MDIIYLIKVLIRRKWIILFSLMIGLLGGFVFKYFQKKEYVSYAQYATGLFQTSKVSLQLNEIFDINQIDLRLNNVIETFRTPTVMGMMSYDLLLHDLESSHPFRTLTSQEKTDTAYIKTDLKRTAEILHDKLNRMKLLSTYNLEEKRIWDLLNLYKYDELSLSKKMSIDRVSKTDYITVRFSSENPELSAYVVNEMGIKFKEFYTSLTTTTTKESLSKLDSLRQSKRNEVDDLRNKLQAFRAKIGTPNPGDAATAAMTGLQELTSSLTSQQARLNDLKQERSAVIDQLAVLNSAIAPPTGNNNNNADEILVLRRTNEALATQLAQKGGNDPEIQARIDANTNRIIQLRTTTTSTVNNAQKQQDRKEELTKKKIELESNIASTTDNIKLYETRVEDFRKKAFSGGGEEVVANAYANDLAIAEKDLEKYNSSLFASQDLDVAPDFNFKPMLQGEPAIKPEPSHTILTVAIAGLSMFFLACLLIIILEFLDSSLRTPSIFVKDTKLNVLTVVSNIPLQRKTIKEYFDFSAKSDRDNSSNTFIENLRKLRFEIENSGKKIILVTSLKPEEGKSTVLEALAYTFSMSKKKILLIDANFSNNTLTRQFSAKPTLETFSLSGQENAIDRVWSITTLTSITNTDIVGCNEGNYTPSEILPKNNLLTSLGKIAQHYDFIFIEGAALNNHADSKELSKYVDGIIAVFSAKNSIGEIDNESLQFLTGSKDKFIGSVLNNVDKQNLDL